MKVIRKTPKGEAVWPKLIVPETKFDSAGVYEIRLKFSPENEKVFLSEMAEIYDDAYEQTRQAQARKELPRELPPWKTGKDGRLEFKFKLKASGVVDGERWTNAPPKLFDSKGMLIKNPDPEKFRIGNGSTVRVFFQVRPYFVQKAGITLRLKAVQILQFVQYDDAKQLGVEAESEGFVYEQPETVNELTAGDDAAEQTPLIPDDEAPAAAVITDEDIPF